MSDREIQEALTNATKMFIYYQNRGVLPRGVMQTDNGWQTYGFGKWNHTFRTKPEAMAYYNDLLFQIEK